MLPASLALALWGALLIGAAVLAAACSARAAPAWRRALGLVAALAGALQLVGAASGGTDPLQPLSHFGSRRSGQRERLRFEPVRSVAELDAALARAGRPVMLDFYADWCVSCKEMERFTFSDPQVRAQARRRAAAEGRRHANTADDRALMRRFGLFGPPGTLFFDASGREDPTRASSATRTRERFLQTLQAAGL